MKIFNLVLAVLFLSFAALQLNDDPNDIWFWVFIYSLVAGISAFAAYNKYNMWVLLFGFGAVIYQMFLRFPAFAQWIDMGMPSIMGEMKATSPHVESSREFLGLVICLIVLIFHSVRYARLRKNIVE
ncbi:MAG TPA: transmembrane 220 family protein [Saprospiraceae bacterium]|nr:transmembrane 220 family protein [Saprospiraceae bacterium]